MCGRYKMTAEQRALFDLMPYLEQDEYFDIHGYKMNGDICPGTFIMAVNNRLEAEDVWWTIEDEDRNGVPRRVINAKAENVRNTPMFREAFARDRILVPATGIYEPAQWSRMRSARRSMSEPIEAADWKKSALVSAT